MKAKSRLREKYVQAWVTENEKQIIHDKAKYCDLSVSEYVRKMTIDGVIIKRDFTGIEEVNKIGVNINQIAKKCNERGSIIERDLEELRLQYEKLFEIVYRQILSE